MREEDAAAVPTTLASRGMRLASAGGWHRRSLRCRRGRCAAPEVFVVFHSRVTLARLTRAVLITGIAAVAAIASAASAPGVQVEISGLTPELERNVRAYLSIAQQMGTEAEPLAENRIRRLDNQAPDQIRAALQPFGYYDPTIHSSIRHEKDKWIVRYDIDPGKPTVLTVVDISMQGGGRDSKSVRDAFASIMIKPGDVLNQQRYEAAKQRLSQAAYNAGYIDASYTRSQILVRPKAHEAEIHLNFDTGPRYYFGNITVQQDILNPHFVAQFVPIKPGDPFATDRLLALQQSLDNSGYFSSVIVDVKRDQTLNQRIPIVVRTEPRKTQDYTLGFGYGTDTGPRLSLGVELRRLNRRGHSFTANLRLSSIEQTATGEYRIPVQDVSRDFLAFSTSLGAQTIGDWNTRQLLLGMSWQDQWWGVTRRIYFTAQRERYWTAAITEPTTRELFFPGIQLTEQQADDPIYPRHASSWSLDLRGGSEALGSDASFERLYMVVKLVRPLGKRVRYLLRGEYGAIRTSDFASLPPSQRFYAGGEGSVRGYTYQSLSSSGPAGDSLGGRYLLDGSAELDVLIVGDYGAAVFYDVGNAGNDPWPSLKHGAGVGLRWKSPVGMIGIDFAHPFDEPGTSVRVHLSIGGEL